MTRPLPLPAVALLVAAACSAPEAPKATATPTPAPAPTPPPIAVHILLPAEPDAAVTAWAQALAGAISSGQGGLTLAATPEEATMAVRIDVVEKGTEADPVPEGEGEVLVMRGALLVGDKAHAFSLAYRGDVRPEAGAFARNLRQFAAQATAAASAAPTPESPEKDASSPDTADVEDEG
jgi:hypothetical protein